MKGGWAGWIAEVDSTLTYRHHRRTSAPLAAFHGELPASAGPQPACSGAARSEKSPLPGRVNSRVGEHRSHTGLNVVADAPLLHDFRHDGI